MEYGYGFTEGFVAALMASGTLERAPLTTTTRLMFALIGEAGLALDAVSDPNDKQVRCARSTRQ